MARKRPTISGLGEDVDELKTKVEKLGDSFGDLKGDFTKVEQTIDKLNKKILPFMQNTIDLAGNTATSINKIERAFEKLDRNLVSQRGLEDLINSQKTESTKMFDEMSIKVDALSDRYDKISQASDNFQEKIKEVNLAIERQIEVANQSDATKLHEINKEQTKALEEVKKKYKGVIKAQTDEEEKLSNLNTRSRILSETIQEIYDTTQQRQLPFMKGLSIYLEKGGTRAEYFAQYLTSTREEVKIFGFEVEGVRRAMYGFMPPGTFRVVNKFASALNFVGGTMRSLRADAEGTGNVLTKVLFASTFDRKGIKRLKKQQREATKVINKTKADIQRIDNKLAAGGLTAIEISGLEEQKKFLQEVQKTKKEERKELSDKEDKARKGMFGNEFMSKFDEFSEGIRDKLGFATDSQTGMVSSLLEEISLLDEGLDSFFSYYIENGTKMQKLGAVIGKFAKMALKFMFMASMYLIIFALLLTAVSTFIDRNRDVIEEGLRGLGKFVGWVLSIGFGFLVNAYEGLLTFFNGLITGDGKKALEGLLVVGFNLFMAGVTLILGFAGTLIGVIIATGYVLLKSALRFIFDTSEGFRGFFARVIGLVAAIAIMIGILILLPVQLPIILIAAITYAMSNFFGKGLKKLFGAKEKGGMIDTPMTLVGEKGPELLVGGRGSNVISNKNTKKVLGRGNTVNNFNITINAKDTSKAEMRRIADEIGRMVNSKINRNTSSSTLR